MVRRRPPFGGGGGGGPLGEERGAELVNGSKVYNVRFYSPSIIHGWKRQERERGKGGQEQAEGGKKRGREDGGRRGGSGARRRVCAQTAVDVGAALRCPFAKCGRNAQCVAAMFCSLKALPDVRLHPRPSRHSEHTQTARTRCRTHARTRANKMRFCR